MEICTCSKCRHFQFTDQDGQQIQGVLVSQSTRNRHWANTSRIDESAFNNFSKLSVEEDTSNDGSQSSSDKSENSHSSSTHKNTAMELT
ncbi:hypothetical protein O181_061711, partial [Austropuccinia psidii MF-1]|nr:hypothetical protein [Austropuccinia psidii MF-1]